MAAFPWWLMILSIFSCTYWIFVYLLWRNVYSDLLTIFKLHYSFYYWFMSSLYSLDTNSLSDIWVANICFQPVGCLFAFLVVSIERQKFLVLMRSSLSNFSSVHTLFLSPTMFRQDERIMGVNDLLHPHSLGFPRSAHGKEPTCRCRRHKRCAFQTWVGKNSWWGVWQLTPILLPGESHRQRSLKGYSPWGPQESTWLKWLSMHPLYRWGDWDAEERDQGLSSASSCLSSKPHKSQEGSSGAGEMVESRWILDSV